MSQSTIREGNPLPIPDEPRRINIPWLATFLLLVSSYTGYSAGVLRLLNRHRKSIPDYFSSESDATTLNWLAWTTVTFFFTGIFTGIFTTFIPMLVSFRAIPPGLADAYGLTFFIFVFGMFSVKQPPLYKKVQDLPETSTHYARSGLSDSDRETYRKELETYMEKEKPYRNNELTIADVADALSISRHHLTQVLNNELKMNFFHFINRFRVDEAIRFMKNPDYGGNLLDIAFDSGFNSKSTFNRVFKSYIGMTPSEYREITLR